MEHRGLLLLIVGEYNSMRPKGQPISHVKQVELLLFWTSIIQVVKNTGSSPKTYAVTNLDTIIVLANYVRNIIYNCAKL